MDETELPQGRTKFVFGQKIDSIELRATKMAAKGEGQSTGNRMWLTAISIEAKEPDCNGSLGKQFSTEEYERR
jgi:hypothetical protein